MAFRKCLYIIVFIGVPFKWEFGICWTIIVIGVCPFSYCFHWSFACRPSLLGIALYSLSLSIFYYMKTSPSCFFSSPFHTNSAKRFCPFFYLSIQWDHRMPRILLVILRLLRTKFLAHFPSLFLVLSVQLLRYIFLQVSNILFNGTAELISNKHAS